MPSATVKKRQGKPPLIVPPPGPHVRRPKGWKPPPPNTRRDKALQRFLDDLLKSKNKGGKVLYMNKGGKVYRKLGGKVTNGNDVVRMIYEGDN